MNPTIAWFYTWIKRPAFFYGLLAINCILACTTRFIPSMDGPAHLHNAQLLISLLSGNAELAPFYSLTNLSIPNWLSHVILGAALAAFPAWLAEKVLILGYICGMAFSFRYLVRQINPENGVAGLLIFPFIYSILFRLGFYNFSLAFVGYFLGLAYFIKFWKQANLNNYILLFLILLATYYANALIYGFLGLTLGLLILSDLMNDSADWKEKLTHYGKQLLLLFLIALPSLVLAGYFFFHVNFFPSSESGQGSELTKWLLDARPFIVYGYVPEETWTSVYVIVLISIVLISFLKGRKVVSQTNTPGNVHVLLIPAIISLIAYYAVPNGSGAGMMTDRFSVMLFLFGIVWIATRLTSGRAALLLIGALLIAHLAILFRHTNRGIKSLNADAIRITMASQHIDKNSIVLPINLSEHWLQPHFSNYLGIDKPLVILENYECSVGWFPVTWNENFPNITLGSKNQVHGLHWQNNTESADTREIDCVFLYGNTNKIKDTRWDELRTTLDSTYVLSYSTPDNYILLYHRLK